MAEYKQRVLLTQGHSATECLLEARPETQESELGLVDTSESDLTEDEMTEKLLEISSSEADSRRRSSELSALNLMRREDANKKSKVDASCYSYLTSIMARCRGLWSDQGEDEQEILKLKSAQAITDLASGHVVPLLKVQDAAMLGYFNNRK